MQITIENLQRARATVRSSSKKCFAKAPRTLLAELGNLKTIIGRFSDFAKMPAPELEPVNLNEIVREVMQLVRGPDSRAGASADRSDSSCSMTSSPRISTPIRNKCGARCATWF